MTKHAMPTCLVAVTFFAAAAWAPDARAQIDDTTGGITIDAPVNPLTPDTTPTTPSTGGSTLSELPLPRNNVKLGALQARRPGNWIQSGVAVFNERHDLMLQEFGGLTIGEQEQTLRDQILPTLVESLVSSFQTFATLLGSFLTGTVPTIPTTGA